MKVRFKKLDPKAIIPSYSKPGDAGLDLTAVSVTWNRVTKSWDCLTGLSVEIPEGYVGLIFPRSSIVNTSFRLKNSVGVIDSGYRGEIKLMFDETEEHNASTYQYGNRVGQLIILPYPTIEPEEATALTDTSRGSGGFGSTGK